MSLRRHCTTWRRWTSINYTKTVSFQFARVEAISHFVYPNLRDGSDLILASDYSGESGKGDFQVLAFLVTTKNSVLRDWDKPRLEVRAKYLTVRRMSFKDLNDAYCIYALSEFLKAASRLSGVLVSIAVDKKLRLPGQEDLLQHRWDAKTLEKLRGVCFFGGLLIDGLRGIDQNVRWITDDDAIVANDNAKADARNIMGRHLHLYPYERCPVLTLDTASQFTLDDFRAEDLLAIPDLAAGAFSDGINLLGKANMPTAIIGVDPNSKGVPLRVKSSLISAWRLGYLHPLKHLSVVIRAAAEGQMMVSFCEQFTRLPRADETVPQTQPLSPKWRRALEADLRREGIDPVQMLKSMGAEGPPTPALEA